MLRKTRKFSDLPTTARRRGYVVLGDEGLLSDALTWLVNTVGKSLLYDVRDTAGEH